MCRSKAEGGKRCFTHAMDDDYVDLKKRRAKAKAKDNVEEAKALLLEMLTTEEGIEELERRGELEVAAKMVRRRNRKIAAYNLRWKDSKPYFRPYEERDLRPLPGYRLQPLWNRDGFNTRPRQPFVHHETRTLYCPQGFNRWHIHQATGTRFNEDGFDWQGYDERGLNAEGWDRQGYDADGFDAEGFGRSVIATRRDQKLLEFEFMTLCYSRPNAEGHRFARDGSSMEPEAYPNIWGWIDRPYGWIHVGTGTELNPEGREYFEDRRHREESETQPWYLDPAKRWW